MVSVNPHPHQAFCLFDPINRMGLPGLNPPPPSSGSAPAPFPEDPSKKVRKPYTITKSRESWSEQEHDKFLEALTLFDRDWKKIEAFVGSKTVIQIRSHAQKYFLKVQKSGTSEHVPPPRPKRKAAHPYPQKGPRYAPFSEVNGPSSALFEPGYAVRPNGVSVPLNPASNLSAYSWSHNASPSINVSQATTDDAHVAGTVVPGCYSSCNESKPDSWPNTQTVDQDNEQNARAVPDFAQVYQFIGSVFDPGESGHLQRLKQMEPIDLETASLLMKNLCVNLMSPEFEEHRRLLASYNDENPGRAKAGDPFNFRAGKSESPILSV